MPLSRWPRALLLPTAALAIVFALPALPRNFAYLSLARALAAPDAARVNRARAALERLGGRPEAAYGLGLLGAPGQWQAAIRSDARYVPLVRQQAAADLPLATLATELYPELWAAWDWLGDALPATRPAEALEAYRRAVELDPARNLVWEKIIGLAHGQGDDALALTAARRACDINNIRNGACHGAARLAFAAANWPAVIYYFERGRFPEHAEDWALLIRAAEHLGREADTARYLLMARRRNPADYDALLAKLP